MPLATPYRPLAKPNAAAERVVLSDAYAGAQTTRTVPDHRSDRRRLPQQACQPDEANDKHRAAPNNHAIDHARHPRKIQDPARDHGGNSEGRRRDHRDTIRSRRSAQEIWKSRHLAREEYADAKSLVAEKKNRKSDGRFPREAAHHDVKHAIHKAEHRLAEARCQAVFKQRPFLQHLDKAREAAATQGHAKRSQHTVEAGPWRAAVVANWIFEDSVRRPAHEGGLGLGPEGRRVFKWRRWG